MKSNFLINRMFYSFLLIAFVMSCKPETQNFKYVSDCSYVLKDSVKTGKVSLFLEGLDTIVVMFDDEEWDPMMKVGSTERDPGSTFKQAGLLIDYSNRDSIYGITIRNTVVQDTLVVMDTLTKEETIQVIENTVSDTLGSCLFRMEKAK